VAGDSSRRADLGYRDSLQALAKTLGINKKIIFTGWLQKQDLWKIYLASDLFIMPSLSEGMPNTMLEALGLNLPCLGSRIPGIMDILHYEELLFDPKNNIGLANRVHKFFSDNHFSDKMRRLCEERRNTFTFDWKEELFQTVAKGVGA
jgi:glycosyltransferase involved in cell wall biosynthesis